MNDSHSLQVRLTARRFRLLVCVVQYRVVPPSKRANNHQIVYPPALLITLTDTMEIKDIKEKFGRFRILVIGRANAGKTTILKKICNSTENPEIYDDEGYKVRSYFMPLILQSPDGLRPGRSWTDPGI